ncbi:MAG: alpha-2-macroglobulin family protein, partial [Chloroflexales bacterium]
NAPLHWRLLADPYYFSSDSAPGFQFENLDDAYASYRWFDGQQATGGEQVAEGSATTDAQGSFPLSLPAGTASDTHSRALTLDVEVTDVDGQVIAGQGNLRLHAGAFYIGLRPDGYVAQIGKPQTVDVITLDPQGQPVAGRSVDVGIYQREWYSVREQGPDGRFYFTSAYTDTLQQTIPAKTDDKGRASVSFTPRQAGSYRIAATGRDDGGRTVTSSAFTWAAGGDAFWGVNDSNRIDLIADRTGYKPGDTAKILVTAPYKGSTALITIERGEVISHRIMSIVGTSELLEVPISADYAPNVYVSVVLITPAGSGNSADAPAAPDVRVGLVNLAVSTEQQDLTVSVSPDKQQAGPRDSITYTVTTKDYSGKGVPAEVSLALVDKAVLTLADDPNPSLHGAFYEKRPLGIFTSQSIIALADRVNLALGAGAKGGGGGMSAPALVRRDFPDTAYWNAGLITGADGTASVTVALPDSLTTWRMSARGVTKETLVGQSTSDVVAARPLLVRASLPRFLTDGDQPTLQAVVQNSTSSAIDASVTLGLSGTADKTGPITLQESAVQQVSVPANGQALVRWKAKVAGAGQVTVRLSVSGGDLQDALETTLPVQRYETPEVSASAGQVIDTTVETLRPTGDPARGEATLELAPSLAAGVQGGLSYLESFPYACTEQTVSAFLPNAVTYRLYKQLGVDNPALKASLEANLAKGLQRLYALQQLDGGWGWWESDKSQPYLSAYVVQGLTEAKQAGYSVDQAVLDRGVAYLKGALDQGADQGSGVPEASQLNTRAYTLFVLGELGQGDRGRAVGLYDQRAKLDIYGRAYLLMALKDLGDDTRSAALADNLSGAAIMRTTDAHWEEGRADYWTMGSDTRSTALALQALVRADPSSILVPNAVRYLMGLREHGHWASTQETAVTLLALAEYVAQSGELKASYSYRVALNDKSLSEGSVDSTNLDTPIELVVKLADLAQGTDSQLSMQRQAGAGQSGTGRLYYTLRVRSFEDAASVQALDQGVSVRREYVMVNTATLSPTGQLTSQAALGDLVQVRLTLSLPEDMPYFMVEDMLPAGLEALDTSLKTSSAAARDPAISGSDAQPYWWYFGRTEVRDNRVALFASDLPRGTYTYTYLARATTPGVFQTLPATAMRTYAPEVFGRSAGAQFTVTAP